MYIYVQYVILLFYPNIDHSLCAFGSLQNFDQHIVPLSEVFP